MSEVRENGPVSEANPRDEVERLAAQLARCEEKLARSEGELARRGARAEDLSLRLAGLVGADNARQVHIDNLRGINHVLRRRKDEAEEQLAEVLQSRTWRMLTALRKLKLRLLALSGSR